jgi:uncharacterized repeat protein (TIGR04076 family)
MKDLIITVVEIKGNCPVYKKGNKIFLDEGYKVNLSKTDAICMHSLASILPYYNALSRGVKAKELGLTKKTGNQNKAYLQCLDPCEYTNGGTVIFEVETLV